MPIRIQLRDQRTNHVSLLHLSRAFFGRQWLKKLELAALHYIPKCAAYFPHMQSIAAKSLVILRKGLVEWLS